MYSSVNKPEKLLYVILYVMLCMKLPKMDVLKFAVDFSLKNIVNEEICSRLK